MRYVVFSLADQLYAISVEYATEIALLPKKVTPLPDSEPYIKGIMNLRGRVIPLIDLAEKISLADKGERRKVIVTELAGKAFGLLVDDVLSIDDLGSLEKTPVEQGDLVEGIARRDDDIIVVLKPEYLI